MMNHAVGGDVTLGHYVGKSEAQLRAGWQTVADFIEAAAAPVGPRTHGVGKRQNASVRRATPLHCLNPLSKARKLGVPTGQ